MAGIANLFALIDQLKRNVGRNLQDPMGAVELGLLRADEDFKADPVNTVLGNANIGGGLIGAITPETYSVLKNMTRDQFMGSPKIVGKSDAAQLRPNLLKSTQDAELVPFMGGQYQAKFSPSGATVFDGDKVIASYNFGDNLVVDPKYRKKGIAEELVYQQRTYFPEPAKAKTRNKISQKIQENVYDRIQTELPRYNPTNGLLD